MNNLIVVSTQVVVLYTLIFSALGAITAYFMKRFVDGQDLLRDRVRQVELVQSTHSQKIISLEKTIFKK